ncbi:11977_t:CDS:2, partial [Acaulospora morrowiae]
VRAASQKDTSDSTPLPIKRIPINETKKIEECRDEMTITDEIQNKQRNGKDRDAHQEPMTPLSEDLGKTAEKEKKNISIQRTEGNRKLTWDQAPKNENTGVPNNRNDDMRKMMSKPEEDNGLAQDTEKVHHQEKARNRPEDVPTNDQAEGNLDEKMYPKPQREVDHVERVGEAVQRIDAMIRNQELTCDEVSVAHDCTKLWEETFRTMMPGINEKIGHRTEAGDEPEKRERKLIMSQEQHQGGGREIELRNTKIGMPEVRKDVLRNDQPTSREIRMKSTHNCACRTIIMYPTPCRKIVRRKKRKNGQETIVINDDPLDETLGIRKPLTITDHRDQGGGWEIELRNTKIGMPKNDYHVPYSMSENR